MRVVLFTALCIALSGCCQTLSVAGVKYRMKGAYKAEMGAAGVLSDSGCNMFDQKRHPKYEGDVSVVVRTQFYSEKSRTVALDVLMAPRDAKPGAEGLRSEGADAVSADADAGYVSSERAKFVVFEFSNPLDLVDSLNAPANSRLRSYLASSDMSRVVTSVAVIYGHERIANLSGDVHVGAAVGGVAGDIGVRLQNGNVLRVSDGTVFAYEYSRLIWALDSQGDLRIFDLAPDRLGGDVVYPKGKSNDPLKLLQGRG